MTRKSNQWENCDSFGTREGAEQFMQKMVNKDPAIWAGRVFDQIANQAGQEYVAKSSKGTAIPVLE